MTDPIQTNPDYLKIEKAILISMITFRTSWNLMKSHDMSAFPNSTSNACSGAESGSARNASCSS